jgi:hypothetical protein
MQHHRLFLSFQLKTFKLLRILKYAERLTGIELIQTKGWPPTGVSGSSKRRNKRSLAAVLQLQKLNKYQNIYSATKTAFIVPSWPGLDVILALPFSVSMIEPFVMMFRLTKYLFAGLPTTLVILVLKYFFVFGSKTFAMSAESNLVLRVPPTMRDLFFLTLPSFVSVGVLPSS